MHRKYIFKCFNFYLRLEFHSWPSWGSLECSSRPLSLTTKAEKRRGNEGRKERSEREGEKLEVLDPHRIWDNQSINQSFICIVNE